MPFHALIGTMPSISLKLIVIVHWILVIWALLDWGPTVFVWCNVTVLAVGVWAIGDRQSVDALFMFIVMHLMSIVVDIVVLSIGFPSNQASGAAKFSAGMCILNLILKPFSTILLYQMYRDRGGEYNINFGANNTAYDHIGDDSTGSSADFRNVLNPSQQQQQQPQRPPQYQQSNNQYGGGSKEQPLV